MRQIGSRGNFSLPLNLGFFGEGGADTGTTQTTDTTQSTADLAQTTTADTAQTITADAAQTSTTDATKTAETATAAITAADVAKLIKTQLEEFANKQTEAQKLANMTEEQRLEHENKSKEDAINNRIAEVTKRELRIEAHKTLTEKGLPAELLDVLQYTDADACNSSIAAVEKAFRASVEKGINERLRGNPLKTSNNVATITLDQIGKMSQDEIMANMAEIEKVLSAK